MHTKRAVCAISDTCTDVVSTPWRLSQGRGILEVGSDRADEQRCLTELAHAVRDVRGHAAAPHDEPVDEERHGQAVELLGHERLGEASPGKVMRWSVAMEPVTATRTAGSPRRRRRVTLLFEGADPACARDAWPPRNRTALRRVGRAMTSSGSPRSTRRTRRTRVVAAVVAVALLLAGVSAIVALAHSSGGGSGGSGGQARSTPHRCSSCRGRRTSTPRRPRPRPAPPGPAGTA